QRIEGEQEIVLRHFFCVCTPDYALRRTHDRRAITRAQLVECAQVAQHRCDHEHLVRHLQALVMHHAPSTAFTVIETYEEAKDSDREKIFSRAVLTALFLFRERTSRIECDAPMVAVASPDADVVAFLRRRAVF